ncbi:MAG: KH domain-containing protein [Candidatus Micrarchaeota archaeon]
MLTPICKSCAWTKALCPECRQKADAGAIKPLDIEISRILYRINETHNISRASFLNSADFGDVVIILTDSEPGILIGRRGKVVSAISLALGRKVRVVKKDNDIKRLVSDLVSPARLIGINASFSDGQEKLKVRICPPPGKRLYIGKETLQSVIKSWIEKDVEVFIE